MPAARRLQSEPVSLWDLRHFVTLLVNREVAAITEHDGIHIERGAFVAYSAHGKVRHVLVLECDYHVLGAYTTLELVLELPVPPTVPI